MIYWLKNFYTYY